MTAIATGLLKCLCVRETGEGVCCPLEAIPQRGKQPYHSQQLREILSSSSCGRDLGCRSRRPHVLSQGLSVCVLPSGQVRGLFLYGLCSRIPYQHSAPEARLPSASNPHSASIRPWGSALAQGVLWAG